MYDYLSMGSTPYDEPRLQVGHCSAQQQRQECRIFINQIERYYPAPEDGLLTIRGSSHDFGTYYEVNCKYNEDDEATLKWALDVEGDHLGKLATWDKEALEELSNFPNYHGLAR